MKRLNRLSQIADLLLDAKLVKLREAARARDESLSHLAALQLAAAPSDDPLLLARVAVR
ncbi:hypothetical protein [Falsirhodobacter deserti]|uniref:hypothetical protein n=1 Tax=Falsirhodobacter deserti TaxID=1365611 RepID=UPI0013E2E149|nr:hypothetical protein [Falsirhodobacter deserti]